MEDIRKAMEELENQLEVSGCSLNEGHMYKVLLKLVAKVEDLQKEISDQKGLNHE